MYFIFNGYRAVVRLTWDGKKKTWLVTNFLDKKIKNPDDTDAFVRSVSTADGTISPSEQDSSVDSSIPQQKTKRNEKIGSLLIARPAGNSRRHRTGALTRETRKTLPPLRRILGGSGKAGRFPSRRRGTETHSRKWPMPISGFWMK